MQPEPSAPPLEVFKDEHIGLEYNSEQGCDVEFLVGKEDGDRFRIPVHSTKLKEFPVFRALLTREWDVAEGERGSGGNLRRFPVHDVDGKAFDNMMKFIYNKRISLTSCDNAIQTLLAAHKYLIPDLVRECVKALYKMISLSTVIYIFAQARYLCNDLEDLEERTKAEKQVPFPRRSKVTCPADELGIGLEIKNLCLWLLCQCLSFIDAHASLVMERDEFEELDKNYMKFLLSRDSLRCSESAVFSALIYWAETECKRQHKPLTLNSKRSVLGDLVFVPRYLSMSLSEFLKGPADSGILQPCEVQLIRNVLTHGQPFPPLTSACGKKRLRFPTSTKLYCCPTTKSVQLRLRDYLNCSSSIPQEEVKQFLSHMEYMSRPRNTAQDLDSKGGRSRKRSTFGESRCGTKRRRSASKGTFKRAGVLVKNLCIPWRSRSFCKGMKKAECESKPQHPPSDLFVKRQQQQKSKKPKGKKESKLSKFFDYSLQVFAFFFD